jgi:hypothetical protein
MDALVTDPLDRLLRAELDRLTDRLAAAGGGAALLRGDMAPRLEQLERRLTELRQGLLASYLEWRAAIEACEDLSALAALRAEQPPRVDRRAA